jgi:acyl-CoA thioesterase-1
MEIAPADRREFDMLFSFLRQITARPTLSLAYGARQSVLQSAGAIFIMLCLITLASAQQQPARIVALGDSLSAGYLLPQKNAFPTVLERVLREKGRKVEVSNAGVSGDTASGGLERLDWAVGDGADLVIVELGANDMLRGVDPSITRKALAGIITRLQAKKIPVLLAGMVAAPGMGRDYETKFNAIFGDLAREFGVPLYPFFLEGVAGNRSLLLPDGLHPTPEGVETIVRGILPSVEALLPKP